MYNIFTTNCRKIKNKFLRKFSAGLLSLQGPARPRPSERKTNFTTEKMLLSRNIKNLKKLPSVKKSCINVGQCKCI